MNWALRAAALAALSLSLSLGACASAPASVVVVPSEPPAPGEASAWAKACVYGPLKAPVPAGARSLASLSQGQRAALADIERFAQRSYGQDGARRHAELERLGERLRHLPPARLQDYRKAAQWRADIIERRVPYKKHLRQQSPCYGLLLDVYHRAGSALDWGRREATRPPPVTATGVTVEATRITPIEGGWRVVLDRGKIHGVEAGDWARIRYQGEAALLVVERVQVRQAQAIVRPKLPLVALRPAVALNAGPAPKPRR